MAQLLAVSGNLDYVSNRLLENVHPMGVFEKAERAQRLLGYP